MFDAVVVVFDAVIVVFDAVIVVFDADIVVPGISEFELCFSAVMCFVTSR